MVKEESKDVLDEFLWNLKIEDYEKVIENMTVTFRSQYTKNVLLDWADSCIPFKILSYKILGRHPRTDGIDGEVFHTYKIELVNSGGKKYYSFPNVVREVKPYKASKEGIWGVNPISAIPKELYQKNKVLK